MICSFADNQHSGKGSVSSQNKELGARVLTLQFGTKLGYKLVI